MPPDSYSLQPLTVVLDEDQTVKFRIAAAVFPSVGSTIEVPNGNVAKVCAVRLCTDNDGSFYVAIDAEFFPRA